MTSDTSLRDQKACAAWILETMSKLSKHPIRIKRSFLVVESLINHEVRMRFVENFITHVIKLNDLEEDNEGWIQKKQELKNDA